LAKVKASTSKLGFCILIKIGFKIGLLAQNKKKFLFKKLKLEDIFRINENFLFPFKILNIFFKYFEIKVIKIIYWQY
jgi:hypothetical protein